MFLNDVVLNQPLVHFQSDDITRVQAEGSCWAGGATWQNTHVMPISVSNCRRWNWTSTDRLPPF